VKVKTFGSEQFVYRLSKVVSAIYDTTEAPIETYLSLHVLERLLTKLAARDIEQHDILPAFYGVLLALRDCQHCSPTELRIQLLVSRSNMTSLLDRMERDDLIKRERDPYDRRKLRISLTKHGQEVSEKVLTPHLTWVHDTMSPLSKADLDTLTRILAKLWRELIRQAEEADLSVIKDLKNAVGG
jgi:MarR family 2-MHQ and catechol resistance regulon transcriptional repressor